MPKLDNLVESLMSSKSKDSILSNIEELMDFKKKKPKTLKEMANISIHNFKDLSADESKLISNLLNVKSIRDLANVSYKEYVNNLGLLREAGIPKKKIELIMTAAKYIASAVDYKPVEGQKIVVAGLDNAGKTALLKVISKEVGGLSNLKPTPGLERGTLHLETLDLFIFELGGQSRYRQMYINDPERYILQTDMVVFLIDMQDDERYSEALDYLEKLLNIFQYLKESADWIVLLHKCDPNILKKDPLFQEKLEYMMEQVKTKFETYIFHYEIQKSSIYNIASMSQSFSDMLKGLLTGGVEQEEKMQSMAHLLEEVVALVLNLETNFKEQLDLLRQNLYQLNVEFRNFTQKASSGEPLTPPKPLKMEEPPSMLVKPTKTPESARSALINELKNLFVKRG
jgi:GTPase SAR1 family protein